MDQVTVVIATYRPQGALVPLRGLAEQSFTNFDVVVVSEIGMKAVELEPAIHLHPFTLIGMLDPPAFHAPTLALNAGLATANTPIVAFLADFAYPDKDWLKNLVAALTETGASFVGGAKCPHGTTNSMTCIPAGGAGACDTRNLLPLLVDKAPERVAILPTQSVFNLGNCAFWRADANAVNGLEDRFAGGHGHEDENFVRRLMAHRKLHPVLAKNAVIHHYWPYASGFKPLMNVAERHWAQGFTNAELDRLLIDSELVLGNLRATSASRKWFGGGPFTLCPRETPTRPEDCVGFGAGGFS